MKRWLAVVLLVIAGCARLPPEVVEVSTPGDCRVRLTARAGHPYLAEFEREVVVACGGGSTALELEYDPGGLGRVELVATADGALALTDAFRSVTLSSTDATVLVVHDLPGKIDVYRSRCGRSPVFHRAEGTFLGAFDYCEHRWQWLH